MPVLRWNHWKVRGLNLPLGKAQRLGLPKFLEKLIASHGEQPLSAFIRISQLISIPPCIQKHLLGNILRCRLLRAQSIGVSVNLLVVRLNPCFKNRLDLRNWRSVIQVFLLICCVSDLLARPSATFQCLQDPAKPSFIPQLTKNRPTKKEDHPDRWHPLCNPYWIARFFSFLGNKSSCLRLLSI